MTDTENTIPEVAPPAWWPADLLAVGFTDDEADYWYVAPELRAAYADVPLEDHNVAQWIKGARAFTSIPRPDRPLPDGYEVIDAKSAHGLPPHVFAHLKPGMSAVHIMQHSHAKSEARAAMARAQTAAVQEAQNRRVCVACGRIGSRFGMAGLRLLPTGPTLACCVGCRPVLAHAFTAARAQRLAADGRTVAERAAEVAALYPHVSGTADASDGMSMVVPTPPDNGGKFTIMDPVPA